MQLLAEDSDDIIPLCVATCSMDMLVQFFTSRGQLQDAMMAAAAVYEGNIVPTAASRQKTAQNGTDSTHAGMKCVISSCITRCQCLPSEKFNNANKYCLKLFRLLKMTTSELAEWHFLNGSPILAACCHLSVDDTKVDSITITMG